MQSVHGPGDLARRIAQRRKELGLSVDQLASAAGVDPDYLRYFEGSSEGRLSTGALDMIATALRTSPADLLGGDRDRPFGRGQARGNARLRKLTPQQCETYLRSGGVGRILFHEPRGPVALPVNYVVVEREIVFRTDFFRAAALLGQEKLGFQIDRVDESMSEGWSVLVSGPPRRVIDPDEIARLSVLKLQSWAGGYRPALVALAVMEMTGRVIVHPAAHADPQCTEGADRESALSRPAGQDA